MHLTLDVAHLDEGRLTEKTQINWRFYSKCPKSQRLDFEQDRFGLVPKLFGFQTLGLFLYYAKTELK